MQLKAQASDTDFETLANPAKEKGDKRFLAQLAGVKALAEKGEWRGVTLGCRMLYRIAQEGGYLDQVETALRPLFDFAVEKFEKQRAARKQLRAKLASVANRIAQTERLSTLLVSLA